MNLVKCPDCSKEVSKNAQKCPHCGAKLKMGGFSKTIIIIIGIFVAIVLIALVNISNKPPHIREADLNKSICDMNIGKSPVFTKEICEYNYQRDLNKR